MHATLSDGRPAERAWVQAWLPGATSYEIGVTDERGEVVLGPLPAGDVSVEVNST
jgi:hypothetical protein